MSASQEHKLQHPLWPWILVLAGLSILGLGAAFVVSWVLLALLGY